MTTIVDVGAGVVVVVLGGDGCAWCVNSVCGIGLMLDVKDCAEGQPGVDVGVDEVVVLVLVVFLFVLLLVLVLALVWPKRKTLGIVNVAVAVGNGGGYGGGGGGGSGGEL